MSGAQHFNKPNKKHPCIHKKKSHFTWFCCWPSKQHYVWHQGAFSYSGYITHSRQRSRSQLTATDCSISLIPISSTWLFTAGLVLSLWWCLSSGPLYERGSPTHTHTRAELHLCIYTPTNWFIEFPKEGLKCVSNKQERICLSSKMQQRKGITWNIQRSLFSFSGIQPFPLNGKRVDTFFHFFFFFVAIVSDLLVWILQYF